MIVNDITVSYGSVDDRNMLSIIEMVRKGVRYTHFLQLVKNSPFKMQEWSSILHLSERTMQRYETENKVFDPLQSEKIVQIAMLNKYGIEVFGSKENFNIWLQSTNIALGGILPKELLDSNFGIELIKDELTKIEHGVLA
jgi:putative toxin-antitoxin system antitoxin component (TIGR02293 family)